MLNSIDHYLIIACQLLLHDLEPERSSKSKTAIDIAPFLFQLAIAAAAASADPGCNWPPASRHAAIVKPQNLAAIEEEGKEKKGKSIGVKKENTTTQLSQSFISALLLPYLIRFLPNARKFLPPPQIYVLLPTEKKQASS